MKENFSGNIEADGFVSELEKNYKIQVNEYKMLNKTLMEMCERGSDPESVEDVKRELDEMFKSMEATRKYLMNCHSSKGTTYEPCGQERGIAPKKPVQGIFDLVEDKPKDEEEAPKVIQRKKRERKQLPTERAANGFIDEINQTIDSRCMTNRFLANFKWLDIPEVMVKFVDFSPSRDRVDVCIYDFVDINGYPIIQKLYDYMDSNKSFELRVSNLSACGETLYSTTHSNCKIVGVCHSELNTEKNDFSYIYLSIRCGDTKYEAGSKKNKPRGL